MSEDDWSGAPVLMSVPSRSNITCVASRAVMLAVASGGGPSRVPGARRTGGADPTIRPVTPTRRRRSIGQLKGDAIMRSSVETERRVRNVYTVERTIHST
eukprot:31162-Pelagococcus_subviridis.AAC.9